MAEIVVVDGYTVNPGDNPWEPLEKLGHLHVHDRTSPESLPEIAGGADILITNKCPISAEAIANLPAMKFIAVTATGYNIRRHRRRPRQQYPRLERTGIRNANRRAIHLGVDPRALSSGCDACRKRLGGRLVESPDFSYWLSPQVELAGKNLGLVGYGRIAQQVAKIGAAFGMNVLASGRPAASVPETVGSVAVRRSCSPRPTS